MLLKALGEKLFPRAFFVTGTEIGKGHGGEPILADVRYDSLAKVDFDNLALEVLDNNFLKRAGEYETTRKNNGIYYIPSKERSEIEVVYKGYRYKTPIGDFDTKMG